MPDLYRNLHCPICGRRVSVPVERGPSGTFPEVHVLPEHEPLLPVNLCLSTVVTVTIDFMSCSKCGAKIGKHPSGLCGKCFGES